MLCQQCGSLLSAVTFTCVRGEYCKPSTRIHYNPIYKLWELQQAQPSGFGGDEPFWKPVACYGTEIEAQQACDLLGDNKNELQTI
jgi:hypothetical protein